jgi:hypothetical protein
MSSPEPSWALADRSGPSSRRRLIVALTAAAAVAVVTSVALHSADSDPTAPAPSDLGAGARKGGTLANLRQSADRFIDAHREPAPPSEAITPAVTEPAPVPEDAPDPPAPSPSPPARPPTDVTPPALTADRTSDPPRAL